jgi:hypothetical protein
MSRTINHQQKGALKMTAFTITMPGFVFLRRHDVELEAGFILAGQLVLDLPKTAEMSEQLSEMITAILEKITEMAQSGEIPDEAIVSGWPNGHKPTVDTDNDALLAAWAEDRLTIGVGFSPMDSDQLQQMGLAHPPPDKMQ